MVRDIDKLRTRAEFRLGPRHLALIICTTAVAGGLLFAVANALAGERGADRQKARTDPLAVLEPAEAQEPLRAVPPPSARRPEIEPLDLSFHERLGAPAASQTAAPSPVGSALDDDAAPLSADEPVMPVAAIVPAPVSAAAEIQAPLAPPPALAAVAPAPTPVAAPQHNMPLLARVAPARAQAAPSPRSEPSAPVARPPAQAMQAAPDIQPLPPGSPEPEFEEEPTPDLAQPGERGVFTLQVASYDTQGDAVAFMNMLRQRGHPSFLVRADGGDRGIIWRVRVGPFDSQPAAERYRRRFERAERIPTFVVRRRLAPGA